MQTTGTYDSVSKAAQTARMVALHNMMGPLDRGGRSSSDCDTCSAFGPLLQPLHAGHMPKSRPHARHCQT